MIAADEFDEGDDPLARARHQVRVLEVLVRDLRADVEQERDHKRALSNALGEALARAEKAEAKLRKET